MIRPVELKETRPIELHEGVVSTTTDVWDMLTSSRDGNLDRTKELAQLCPALITCQYDYTSPLHLTVREGHLDLVLAQRKLLLLDAAERLDDLRIPPGNRLEKLAGDRKGQYSIRINEQWRICFRWSEGDAYDVEIVDYH